MRGWILFAGAALVAAFVSQTNADQNNSNAVVGLDPAFDTLVSPDAQVQKVKDGFGFIEGITWVQRGNSG